MNTEKLPISVIIIAHNEEKNLPRCLDSVAKWASEIIAVVNDCSDGSVAILKSYGAKVYEHDWQGFVIQKNRALDYATQPWIFSIDADEEVTPRMQNEIISTVKNSGDVDGLSFCRKTWFMGRWIKHGDWYPDRVIRLFKKSCSRFEGNFLHEKLVVNGTVIKSNANLLHYSFPDLYVFLNKLTSFSKNFLIANSHKKPSTASVVFRSFWKFFRCYFIKLGFLDGYAGLLIAIHQGYSTLFKYSLLIEKDLTNKNATIEAEDR